MKLLYYHFFAYFDARACLYRQLVRFPTAILLLPLLGRLDCQFYTVNKRTYRVRRCAIFAYISALCRFTPPYIPSANEPDGLPFPQLYRQRGFRSPIIPPPDGATGFPFPAPAPNNYTP